MGTELAVNVRNGHGFEAQVMLSTSAMATTKKKSESLFLVHYRDPKDGQMVALRVRSVKDSPLGLSFVSLSDFVFETDSLVINPTEEQMQKRLENVRSLHISIYSIIGIEELGEGPLRFRRDKSNLLVLPGSDKKN